MSRPPAPRASVRLAALTGLRRGLAALERRVAAWERRLAGPARETPDHRAEATPCFVLTPGRTGTMTLAALLGASPRVEAFHEPEPRLVTSSFLAYLLPAGSVPAGFWSEAVGFARDRPVSRAHERGHVYFEASNRMTLLADALAERYPRARFVLLARHPVDFVASALRRGYYAGHPWDHARIRPRPGEADADEWEGWDTVERCGWLWTRTFERGLDFAARVGESRVLNARSEDLFAAEPGLVERIFRFVADTAPPGPRRVRRLLGKRLNRQVGTKAHGRAAGLDEAERARVIERAGDVMRRLGYGE